jgi:hypothetical protein
LLEPRAEEEFARQEAGVLAPLELVVFVLVVFVLVVFVREFAVPCDSSFRLQTYFNTFILSICGLNLVK